jgi:serine/threonine protein kinase
VILLCQETITPLEYLRRAQITIRDLGISKVLKNAEDLTTTYSGSYETMAPEVRSGEKYGLKADLYSLGICLHKLKTGSYKSSPG